jgi:hypothetical protein
MLEISNGNRRRSTSELIQWLLASLIAAGYILVLIPYYGNGIYEYSDYALTIGAAGFHDPQVAQGPSMDDVYGGPIVSTFAFWIGGCLAPYFLFPLFALHSFRLFCYWSDLSKWDRAWRITLLPAFFGLALTGVLNASKFVSWIN